MVFHRFIYSVQSARSVKRPPIALHIEDICPRERFSVQATVTSTGILQLGPSTSYRITVRENSTELDLIFSGTLHVAGPEIGETCIVSGKAVTYAKRIAVWNPRYRVLIKPISASTVEPDPQTFN